MHQLFNKEEFISKYVTGRKESLFRKDLENNFNSLTQEIKDKAVLVIGGAGTIGASFIKALIRYDPKKIIVVDVNENGLTELVRELRSSQMKIPEMLKTYPIDFEDAVFERIFGQEAPFDIVANFAALKHVRSEKDIFSIEAMFETNVFKAHKLLQLLSKKPAKHFFCVSTDKAANPVNIMGASKKIMEDLLLSYSDTFKVTTARFANVAFSNGSLPDGFLTRLSKKQPLSCPSDVKRFFVSPDESGELCLLACILGTSGNIFYPKMDVDNDMISFQSMVKPLLSEFGFEELVCKSEEEAKQCMESTSRGLYPVYYFKSETSGEKLYEEFYTDNELRDEELYESLGVIKTDKRSNASVNQLIINLKKLFNDRTDKATVVKCLSEYLSDFQHIETGLHLDQKM